LCHDSVISQATAPSVLVDTDIGLCLQDETQGPKISRTTIYIYSSCAKTLDVLSPLIYPTNEANEYLQLVSTSIPNCLTAADYGVVFLF
jgi:hypothetical protein